VPGRGCVADLS
jgi:hypothetical protein